MNDYKKEINDKYKPSAYRSGLLVKKYKEEYFKKHKNNNAYTGDKQNSNLKRWFKLYKENKTNQNIVCLNKSKTIHRQ